MKVRKIEFKKVPIIDIIDGKEVQKGLLDYRQTIKDIITQPAANSNGFSTEELFKAVSIYGKIKDAIAKNDESVLIDNEGHAFIVERTKGFRWGFAASEIVDFIKYLQNLPEVEAEVKTPDAEATIEPPRTPRTRR